MTIKTKARPHQVQAIKAIQKDFDFNDRVQVVMACGTGKTKVGIDVFNQRRPKRTLVLAPTIALVKQLLDSYAEQCQLDRVLVVCSDNKAAKEARNKYDIQRVTTNPETIGNELRKRTGELIVFGTYASCDRVWEAYAEVRTPAIDLAILDEAHRLAGRDSDKKAVLWDESIPVKKRLFMTATPRITSDNAKKKSEAMGIDVHSMDDEATFGKVSHELKFSEAIAQGLLADYRLVVMRVTDSDLRNAIIGEEGREFAAKQIGVLKAVKKYDIRKMVMFYSTNVRAGVAANRDIPALFESMKKGRQVSGELWIRQLSGHDSIGHRSDTLNEFATMNGQSRAFIPNCWVLGEGVDCPSLDGIGMMDPMSSQVNIVQAIGRAIRPHGKGENEKVATIVVPVFVPDGDEEAGSILASGPYKTVYQVLLALKDHDDRFANYIKSIAEPRDVEAGEAPIELPDNIVFDGFTKELIGRIQADAVSLEPIRYTEDFIWEKMCEQAEMNGGRFPSRTDSVQVPGLHWDSWGGVQQSLSVGRFGLPGKKSMLELRLKGLSKQAVIEKINSIRDSGEYVNKNSNGIACCGFSWRQIGRMLKSGRLDWGVSSIGEITNGKNVQWSLEMLRQQISELPSRPIAKTVLPCGRTLAAAQLALGVGNIQLALNEAFGKRPEKLTKSRVIKAAIAAFHATGRRPGSADRMPGDGRRFAQAFRVARQEGWRSELKSVMDAMFGADDRDVKKQQNFHFATILRQKRILTSSRVDAVIQANGNLAHAAQSISVKTGALSAWFQSRKVKYKHEWKQAQAEAAKQAAPKAKAPKRKVSE